jgi:hypothetical protein
MRRRLSCLSRLSCFVYRARRPVRGAARAHMIPLVPRPTGVWTPPAAPRNATHTFDIIFYKLKNK